MINTWHLYAMGALYIFAGIMHFMKPKMYLRIMPRYLPFQKPLVLLSGLAEIMLGIGLFFETTKDISLYGIIVMLAVFLLVHFYMLSSKKAGAGFPRWILLLRLPLQFVLMYWAFFYLKV
ncbi:MauE/DoxX family redox-associated membrane protein [uncultured Maribacter sp.]|uniref:DoxX family protein n=1 Tax=uncultured Maribacter sp. TaxID=431308 RepID=UPI0030DB75F1|tara:strand:+ start:301 stop:660 length:360 start_codon:yes stop_codon:yes gene_type:complete